MDATPQPPTPHVPPPAAPPPTGRPDPTTRILATFIDVVIVAVVGLVPLVGGLVGVAYILVRDGLAFDFMDGRSIGKKLMKLRPVRLDGQPMDVNTSIRRNWPLAFGSLAQALLYIPVLGWLLIPFVAIAGVVIVVLELLKVLNAPDGRRWGDTMAGTQVVVEAG